MGAEAIHLTAGNQIVQSSQPEKNTESFWKNYKVELIVGASTSVAAALSIGFALFGWPIAAAVGSMGLAIFAHGYFTSPSGKSFLEAGKSFLEGRTVEKIDSEKVNSMITPEEIQTTETIDQVSQVSELTVNKVFVPSIDEAAQVNATAEAVLEKEEGEEEEFTPSTPETSTEDASLTTETALSRADQLQALSNAVQWAGVGAAYMGVGAGITLPIAIATSVGTTIANLKMLPEDATRLRKAVTLGQPLVIQKLVSSHPALQAALYLNSLGTQAQNSLPELKKAWKELKTNPTNAIKTSSVHFFNLISSIILAARNLRFLDQKPQQEICPVPKRINPFDNTQPQCSNGALSNPLSSDEAKAAFSVREKGFCFPELPPFVIAEDRLFKPDMRYVNTSQTR